MDASVSAACRHRGFVLSLVALVVALLVPQSAARGQATDCTGYDSQVWAQSIYESDPVRYAALDPDGNGLACEELSPGAAPAWWTTGVPPNAEPATLVRITDGDTIRVVLNGVEEPVRLILIDSPETNHPTAAPECFGQEATAFLTWLLSLGGNLFLERDVSERDQFGRLLRYVWLDFGGGEVYLVNEAIVRAGYAAVLTVPPDVTYVEEIRAAHRFAREHGYGLWSGCVTDAEGDTNELTAEPKGIVLDEEPVGPEPEQEIFVDPVEAFGCDPSYPDVCIPPPPPDLDCGDVGAGRFTVLPLDPHNFDGDFDGIGCESG